MTVFQCDSVTVFQCDSVTVLLCDSVTVLLCDSLTVLLCVFQCDSALCSSYLHFTAQLWIMVLLSRELRKNLRKILNFRI